MRVGYGKNLQPAPAVRQAMAAMGGAGQPLLLMAFVGGKHDPAAVRAAIGAEFGPVPVVGGSAMAWAMAASRSGSSLLMTRPPCPSSLAVTTWMWVRNRRAKL
jgi:hypothetical protein